MGKRNPSSTATRSNFTPSLISENTNRTSSSMSSDAPADEAIEETNLLDASDGPQQPPESARNRGYWVQLLANLLGAIKATLSSSIANFLLPLVPLAIISESLNWNSVAVFLLNFFAMLPLASLLSYSTEELSENVGQTLGGLINATCGNLVELIVSCVPNALRYSMSVPAHCACSIIRSVSLPSAVGKSELSSRAW